ncbi:neurotrypsin-like [Pomacea canaliculata]|uniref:neurotrypsin-like n=1 Tax=Pomacea canaliculata TaxID=400727 RepID=UPI000D739A0E|nr:neurotrypsin-like [Pomacea canaliculata]
MKFFSELLIIAISVSVGEAFNWTSSSPDNNASYYACVGDSITFPWSYITDYHETVSYIEWYFSQTSDTYPEVIASFIHGEFFVSSSARQHLSFSGDAGLTVSGLTHNDFGVYSARVVINSYSSLETEESYIHLRLPETPSTTDQQLHARMLPNPMRGSGEWHVQLACGYFTTPGTVAVLWKTPSGQILHNSTFTGDEYVLTLDNPVEEGSYTCFLDVTDPAARCVHISPTMLFSNEVHVDNCSVQRVLGNHANQYGNEEMVLAIKLLSRQHGTYSDIVRLADGSRPWEGRVEVKYYDGTWGTVCDDEFHPSSAVVVCRMLGFIGDSPTVYGSAVYGQGSLPILLDDVSCNGNERTIFDCTHSPVGQHNCQNSEDVGVDCFPNILWI